MTFVVAMALLIANMLIASMAKTFDDVYTDQETNFAFHWARNMLNAEFLEPLPPPLNMLSMPYYVARAVLLVLSCGTYDLGIATDEAESLEAKKHLLSWLPEWKRKVTREEAAAYVLDFVLSHESLAVENGKVCFHI